MQNCSPPRRVRVGNLRRKGGAILIKDRAQEHPEIASVLAKNHDRVDMLHPRQRQHSTSPQTSNELSRAGMALQPVPHPRWKSLRIRNRLIANTISKTNGISHDAGRMIVVIASDEIIRITNAIRVNDHHSKHMYPNLLDKLV